MTPLDQKAKEIASELMTKLSKGELNKIGIEEITKACRNDSRLISKVVIRVVGAAAVWKKQ